jgi:hypothetical protein
VLNFDGFNPTYTSAITQLLSTRILSHVEFWIGCPRFLTYLTKHAQEYQSLDHVADLNLWSSFEHFFNLLEWTIPLNNFFYPYPTSKLVNYSSNLIFILVCWTWTFYINLLLHA